MIPEPTLEERLASIEERMQWLRDERTRLIEEEPTTFRYAVETLERYNWSDRYIIVLADGTLAMAGGFQPGYQQRPAALRVVDRLPNRFVLDRCERVILDKNNTIVHRLDAKPPHTTDGREHEAL